MSRYSSFSKAAIPYAEALLSSSQDMKMLQETKSHLGIVCESIEKSSRLKNFLANPLFQAEAKKKVLYDIFVHQVSKQVLNFLYVLVDRRRIVLLQQVAQCYFDLAFKLELTLVAEVITALPMTKLQKQAIEDRLKCMTNSNEIKLTETVNPELIGGLIIKIGSKVIDMSIFGQLNRISVYLAARA